ncbi:hypothetical protein N7540_008486 [Penicillium herquei]|nr:hypothetical protein N7540_008486 [Penicillium herquei]
MSQLKIHRSEYWQTGVIPNEGGCLETFQRGANILHRGPHSTQPDHLILTRLILAQPEYLIHLDDPAHSLRLPFGLSRRTPTAPV